MGMSVRFADKGGDRENEKTLPSLHLLPEMLLFLLQTRFMGRSGTTAWRHPGRPTARTEDWKPICGDFPGGVMPIG